MTASSAIVLAGGRSSRMGSPKALLDFGGVTLIERIVAELGREFAQVAIVAAPEAHDLLPAALSRMPQVRVIRDARAFAGPAPALVHALDSIDTATAFACGCDAPLIRAELAAALITMLEGYQAAIPIVGGLAQPLCASYRKSAATALRAMLARGERRLTAFAETPNVRRVAEHELRATDPELRSFVNLNTPEDYRRALALSGLAS